jgi:hypothetical protein
MENNGERLYMYDSLGKLNALESVIALCRGFNAISPAAVDILAETARGSVG